MSFDPFSTGWQTTTSSDAGKHDFFADLIELFNIHYGFTT